MNKTAYNTCIEIWEEVLHMKALITGASSGIGRDMARVLAAKGWDLILAARRKERLEELKSELNNVKVICIAADVSTKEGCIGLHQAVRKENIDMLVNNAGFGVCGTFIKNDLDEELQMLHTNIEAVHILTKLFLRDFAQRGSGYILNTASSAGFMAGPMLASYYATKNYVVRLTQAIYEELRRSHTGVHVSVLCPGPVDTEFNQVAKVRFSLKGMKSYDVAKYGIEKALDGKLVIIPGVQMKLAKFFCRFASDKLMLKISYHIQKRKL